MGYRTIRLGFTGTRRELPAEQATTLRMMLEAFAGRFHRVEFHHGDCVGADAEAHRIARDLGFSIVIHPPIVRDNRAFCNGSSGVIVLRERDYMPRNRCIVNDSKRLIACPFTDHEIQRSGTWATVRYARKIGVPITFVWPNGLTTTEEDEE